MSLGVLSGLTNVWHVCHACLANFLHRAGSSAVCFLHLLRVTPVIHDVFSGPWILFIASQHQSKPYPEACKVLQGSVKHQRWCLLPAVCVPVQAIWCRCVRNFRTTDSRRTTGRFEGRLTCAECLKIGYCRLPDRDKHQSHSHSFWNLH